MRAHAVVRELLEADESKDLLFKLLAWHEVQNLTTKAVRQFFREQGYRIRSIYRTKHGEISGSAVPPQGIRADDMEAYRIYYEASKFLERVYGPNQKHVVARCFSWDAQSIPPPPGGVPVIAFDFNRTDSP